MARRFRGVIAIEGIQTGDGRVIAEGALSWDETALSSSLVVLQWSPTDEGHSDVVDVGVLTSIVRDGQNIVAEGVIEDTPGSAGATLLATADERDGNIGVSIVPDDIEFAVLDTSITPEEAEAIEEAIQLLYASAGDPDPGEDGGAKLYEWKTGEIIERWTAARIRALTVVDVPAFIECFITVEPPAGAEPAPAEGQTLGFAAEKCEPCEDEALAAMTAAAAERLIAIGPPAEFFENPHLDRLTPTTIDGDRIFGHLAPWGQCHNGSRVGLGECVLTPRSAQNYGQFLTGHKYTREGTLIRVGQLTVGGGHADRGLSFSGAREHYDDVGSAVADVTVGEDQFGIWFSGAIRRDVPVEQLDQFLAASLSGDWREVGGNLELVAAHAVNVPGFPIARVASGEVVSLVAAGALHMAALRRRLSVGHMAAIADLAERVARLEAAQMQVVRISGGSLGSGSLLEARAQLAALGREMAAERLRSLAIPA